MNQTKVVAFHLPQFHPIPENDKWWGAGFTEWTNVTKAKPHFWGHYQPFLPSDLGFYDLRVTDTLCQQAALGKLSGVDAFCYWHYWFNGRRLLEKPVESILTMQQFPIDYCLGWANQTWSGIWHGNPGKTLIEQTYPDKADIDSHFADVLPHFLHRNYLKIDGCPVFYVFRPEHIPVGYDFFSRWNMLAKQAGFPRIYFVGEFCNPWGTRSTTDFTSELIDHLSDIINVQFPIVTNKPIRLMQRLSRSAGFPTLELSTVCLPADVTLHGRKARTCVYSGWDNTPRSGSRGRVILYLDADRFSRYLSVALSRSENDDASQLVFVKSWNEWAEGNVLEPSRRFGDSFLRSVRDVRKNAVDND